MQFPRRKTPWHAKHQVRTSVYFVTLLVRYRQPLLGEIRHGGMILNRLGLMAQQDWIWLSAQYPYIRLDEFVIMPDHMHGLIVLPPTLVGNDAALHAASSPRMKRLGSIIGAYKTVSTKHINIARNTPQQPVWQRDFHDRRIHDEHELDRIRVYIHSNPYRAWVAMQHHP